MVGMHTVDLVCNVHNSNSLVGNESRWRSIDLCLCVNLCALHAEIPLDIMMMEDCELWILDV